MSPPAANRMPPADRARAASFTARGATRQNSARAPSRDSFFAGGLSREKISAWGHGVACALSEPKTASSSSSGVPGAGHISHARRPLIADPEQFQKYEGSRLLRLTGHTPPVHGAAFVDGGATAVTVDCEGKVQEYDLTSHTERGLSEVFAAYCQRPRKFEFPRDAFTGMQLLYRARRPQLLLTTAEGVFVRSLYQDTDFCQKLTQTTRHRPTCAHASLDGEHIVTAGEEGGMQLWRYGAWKTPQSRLSLQSSKSPPSDADADTVTHCAIGPDASFVVSLDATGQCRLWSLAEAEVCVVSLGLENCRTFCLSRDGRLIATGYPNGCLYVQTTGAEAPFAPVEASLTLAEGETVSCMAFAPDGRTVAIGLESGFIFLWDFNRTPGRRCIRLNNRGQGTVTSLGWADDGRRLLSGSDEDCDVHLWAVPRFE